MLQMTWDSEDPAQQTFDNLQERLVRENAKLNGDEVEAEALAITAKNRRGRGTKRVIKKET